MMKAYLVTVQPGDGRYLDSIWIERAHADERCEIIRDEFVRTGRLRDKKVCASWWAWVTECRIEDAVMGGIKKNQ